MSLLELARLGARLVSRLDDRPARGTLARNQTLNPGKAVLLESSQIINPDFIELDARDEVRLTDRGCKIGVAK